MENTKNEKGSEVLNILTWFGGGFHSGNYHASYYGCPHCKSTLGYYRDVETNNTHYLEIRDLILLCPKCKKPINMVGTRPSTKDD